MSNEEAVLYIQAIPNKIWEQLDECEREAMEMAFQALEKQTPKEPVDFTGFHKGDYCPRCRKRVDKYIDNYCNECGQKLDWS